MTRSLTAALAKCRTPLAYRPVRRPYLQLLRHAPADLPVSLRDVPKLARNAGGDLIDAMLASATMSPGRFTVPLSVAVTTQQAMFDLWCGKKLRECSARHTLPLVEALLWLEDRICATVEASAH